MSSGVAMSPARRIVWPRSTETTCGTTSAAAPSRISAVRASLKKLLGRTSACTRSTVTVNAPSARSPLTAAGTPRWTVGSMSGRISLRSTRSRASGVSAATVAHSSSGSASKAMAVSALRPRSVTAISAPSLSSGAPVSLRIAAISDISARERTTCSRRTLPAALSYWSATALAARCAPAPSADRRHRRSGAGRQYQRAPPRLR